MKKLVALFLGICLVWQCQPKKEQPEAFSFKKEVSSSKPNASEMVDLENKGVGPVTQVLFSDEIDQELVQNGQRIYEEKCTVCHKVGETFIGPPPNDILKRRTPEWVMNMILNPSEMIEKDTLAKALFMEFNGQLMTNQNLKQQEARAILEYFRTL